MLRTGVLSSSKGCSGCARLRRPLPTTTTAASGSAAASRPPSATHQRRSLLHLAGARRAPPASASLAAGNAEQRRALAAARRILDSGASSSSSSLAPAAPVATSAAGGGAAAGGATGEEWAGRPATPTRRGGGGRGRVTSAAAYSTQAQQQDFQYQDASIMGMQSSHAHHQQPAGQLRPGQRLAPFPSSSSASASAAAAAEQRRMMEEELAQILQRMRWSPEEMSEQLEDMRDEFAYPPPAAVPNLYESEGGEFEVKLSSEAEAELAEVAQARQRRAEQRARREAMLRLEEEKERGTIEEALREYREVQQTLFKTGKAAALPMVKRQIFAWYGPMIDAMESLHRRLRQGQWSDLGNGVGTYGPFLALVPPEKLAVLTINETINEIVKAGNSGVPLAQLLMSIAEAVRLEVNYLRLKDTYGDRVLSSLRENGQLSLKRINRKAKEALEDGIWQPDLKIKVGGMLLNELHRVAKVLPPQATAAALDGEEAEATAAATVAAAEPRPALRVEREATPRLKKRGLVFLDHEAFAHMAAGEDEDLKAYLTPRYRPMVVRPRRWRSYDEGGYLDLRTYVVRSQNNARAHFEALKRARMPQVYDALNFLGGVKWVINGDILDTINEAYARGLTIGDLPSREDLALPTEPSVPASEAPDRDQWREQKQLLQRVRKRNAELFSLRCDTELKLRIAEEFREHEFYFPYNLDFRGRAYPVPPNLNHLGSDLCRGMLAFAERRPLGPEGLDWLKIHLANLCGKDKLSFKGRVEYVDAMMAEVEDSSARPLDGRGWWMQAEEPFQALAVCKEIAAAVASGDPAAFLSGVPVHMDGSCNGLQHYAALGRDEEGARQVNLIASEVPQDVYTGVCDRVVRHVHAEATRRLPRTASEEERRVHKYAKLVDGMINRKVVKQTVMTSVYGVTYVGARKQIQARLKEKFQEKHGGRMLTKEEEQDIYEASRYVATVTLSKLAELFSAAREIMEWLATCASLVAKEGQPMAWVTPLGLPVIQPYRRESGLLVKTLLQSVVLVDSSDKLPVSSSRQRSAFPPNFVHSLDSTHMLMTANRLKDRRIPFTAVHDSYWCHAAHVPEMNATLRDCFIDLYHQPILEDLRASLVARYPGVAFPPIPQRGTLDLEEVRSSLYFFD